MIIRAATPADALAMAELRYRSIRDLCGADHGDDPAAIAAWVGQQDKFVRIMEWPENVLLVAEIDGVLAGLAGLYGDMVTLNYVDPAYRFRGVSKGLMVAAETRLREGGVTLGRLRSTATALAFYRSIGWTETGPGTRDEGTPMEKPL